MGFPTVKSLAPNCTTWRPVKYASKRISQARGDATGTCSIFFDSLQQGCPIFAMEGRVHAGFHSNLSLHLLISPISSLFSD